MASQNLVFKNQPCNRLYLKKPTGMHWLGYNDTVSWLNEVKANFEIYLYFVCLPAIRPGCTRCRASEISHDKDNGGRFTKMLFLR